MKHNSPTRKLADALFRGRDGEHSFKVYPISANITDQPAVFIISRRILDKSGRGHHLTICVGETASTVHELKKHKRSQCVKDHRTNVVCLLKEKDDDVRAGIVADLIANRKFSCVKNVYRSPVSSIPRTRSAKISKPAGRTKSNAKSDPTKPVAAE
ncbi:MAG TPA: hypothetical protein VNA22_09875, partial [Pyrinomonadaceae bacterium]|nr:hypothetical protein [Pyrinomonadaceae bacterium]